jgi:hypothetical protein
MKQLRIFALILLSAVALYFLISSFSNSIAEPTRIQKCISCCTDKKEVCFNLNPDRRLCATEFQNCVATCKSEGVASSEWAECWAQSGK